MNPFKQRVLNGQLNAATWIPNGTLVFHAWEMSAGDSEWGTTRGWEKGGGVGVWCCHRPRIHSQYEQLYERKSLRMNGMEKKIRFFFIAYALQIRPDILLEFGMLQSHFHMRFMVCRHQPPARVRKGDGVPRRTVPARGFISCFPLITEERRRPRH